MGINITLYLIKDCLPEKKLDLQQVLQKLGVKSQLEHQGLPYEQLLTELWNRNSTPVIGLSYYNNHFIIQDNYFLIATPFTDFTRDLQTSVLEISNSDTAEVSSFSYYQNGKCLRSKSFGNEYWVQEMQELGIELTEEQAIGNIDEGEPLEYERNGSLPFAVMETYGIAFDMLYELEWELRIIK